MWILEVSTVFHKSTCLIPSGVSARLSEAALVLPRPPVLHCQRVFTATFQSNAQSSASTALPSFWISFPKWRLETSDQWSCLLNHFNHPITRVWSELCAQIYLEGKEAISILNIHFSSKVRVFGNPWRSLHFLENKVLFSEKRFKLQVSEQPSKHEAWVLQQVQPSSSRPLNAGVYVHLWRTDQWI